MNKESLRSLVKEGKISLVLDILAEKSSIIKDMDVRNSFLLYSSRLNTLLKERNLGIVDKNTAILIQNQITDSILQSINQLDLIEESEDSVIDYGDLKVLISRLETTIDELKEQKTVYRKNSLKMIAFFSLVIVLCIFLGFYIYSKNHTESKISKLEQDVNELVVEDLSADVCKKFEYLYIYGDKQYSFVVKEESKRIKAELINIHDSDLPIYSQIYKYIGIGTCNHILSLISDKAEDQKTYSRETIQNADTALVLIERLKNVKDDEERRGLLKWVEDEKHKDRCNVYNFFALAVLYKIEGIISKEELISAYKKLPDEYLTKENHDKYPIVLWLKSQNILLNQ